MFTAAFIGYSIAALLVTGFVGLSARAAWLSHHPRMDEDDEFYGENVSQAHRRF
jgi:hypothetical protein